MQIEHTKTPNSQDINFITDKINQETLEFGNAHPFAFYIRNAKNEIIAGCNGSVIFGSIYTDQLWVDKDHRNKGWGRKLMQQVHAYGVEAGCTMATVNTMSFQNSQAFYEKLGYQLDFTRTGYIKNATCLFFKKVL